jgi:hypothetical protein
LGRVLKHCREIPTENIWRLTFTSVIRALERVIIAYRLTCQVEGGDNEPHYVIFPGFPYPGGVLISAGGHAAGGEPGVRVMMRRNG